MSTPTAVDVQVAKKRCLGRCDPKKGHGRPVGPTNEEGYGVSPGRRVGTTKEKGIVLVQVNYLEVQQQGRSMVLVQGD